MAKLTFLGAGLIGAGLAEAAIGRGDEVTVYNRTREKTAPLAALGARVADTPAAAIVGADRIHVALTDDVAVDAVLAACGEGLDGALVIDHSTTSPAGAAARARALAARGVHFLHAPVFMSPAGCRRAQGMMLCSGPRAIYDGAAEALAAMTGSVRYLGEDPSRAAAYKLFGNAMLIAVIGGLADIFQMARGLEIDPAAALGLFDAFNPLVVLQYRGKAMAAGDFTPGFELAMARKDVRLMLGCMGERESAVLRAIAARMDALIAAGHGAEDLGILGADLPARVD